MALLQLNKQAVDYQFHLIIKGNVLSKMSYDNASEDNVMISHVPTKGPQPFMGSLEIYLLG